MLLPEMLEKCFWVQVLMLGLGSIQKLVKEIIVKAEVLAMPV